VHPGAGSHSSDESAAAAARRRHLAALGASKRSGSPMPAPERFVDSFAEPSNSGSDDEGQQLLGHGSRRSGHAAHSDQASSSAAFDGIEVHDGGSDSGGHRTPVLRRGSSGGGGRTARWRRLLPGLADFYDGITPELVAVALGE